MALANAMRNVRIRQYIGGRGCNRTRPSLTECDMQDATLPPLAHQVPAACRRLGIGRSALYELIKSGEIKIAKFGTRTLIPDAELVKALNKRLEFAA
jgi:excisionase family DNA binding protein